MAKLDRHGPRPQAGDHAAQLVELVPVGGEGGRQLEQEGAELPRLLERGDCLERTLEHRALELGRQANASPGTRLRAVAQVGWQRVEPCRVAGEQAVELHVEGESGRRGARPAGNGVAFGHGIEARVELDDLEALRVPREALAGGHALRVPLLHEAGIGPARGAHEDASGHEETVAIRT